MSLLDIAFDLVVASLARWCRRLISAAALRFKLEQLCQRHRSRGAGGMSFISVQLLLYVLVRVFSNHSGIFRQISTYSKMDEELIVIEKY